MIETHEILCPTFIDCPLCQTKRDENSRSRITNLFGTDEDITILTKHFFHLTISLKPSREIYHHFSLDPLKRSGRELINGLSSISSVSNRRWWNMFVESGVRFYSINQEDENSFPTFNNHFIFFSDKDNLDVRMNTQLKYRLKKISRYLEYKFEYLGLYDIKTIENSIKLGVSIFYGSQPLMKLGDEIISEINKIKEQRPIVFGEKYNKKNTNKLELQSI